jgi:hypothetical protein
VVHISLYIIFVVYTKVRTYNFTTEHHSHYIELFLGAEKISGRKYGLFEQRSNPMAVRIEGTVGQHLQSVCKFGRLRQSLSAAVPGQNQNSHRRYSDGQDIFIDGLRWVNVYDIHKRCKMLYKYDLSSATFET